MPAPELTSTPRLPAFYIPHGGGPCFYMDWTMGPPDTWHKMRAWLEGLADGLPTRPRALLVVSAHWEEDLPTVTTRPVPKLLFDYYGFPAETYELTWPVPAAGDVAVRVRELLGAASIDSAEDAERGLDHGVFVPLKLTFPDAQLPTVQLSLRTGLDASEHLAIGRALAPLRDEGVLIVGSGMSYHNMRGFMTQAAGPHSRAFDAWLVEAVSRPTAERDARLSEWEKAPSARESHPREEHLLPLMVVAGAAGPDAGEAVFHDEVMQVAVTGVRFG